jgi:DNA modification methylase
MTNNIRPEILRLAQPIDSISTHARNVRQGDVGAIVQSLEAHGQYRPIVVHQETNQILAGNHTYLAARSLGWDKIAVTYVDCDDDTALRILIADNRSNDLASYDDAGLLDMLRELSATQLGLEGTLFDDDDLNKLIMDMGDYKLPKDVDDIPEDVPAVSKLGDVWLLGKHRVMCGDSLIVDNLDRLMHGMKAGCVLTDPPYGINLETDYSQSQVNKGKNYKKVLNDDKPFDASLIYKYFQSVEEQFWWGADYYRRTIIDTELSGSWLVWDKRVDEHLDLVIGSAFELCWSRTRHQRKILRYQWTNYTSHINAGHKRAHPTEKPVAMLLNILNDYAQERCVVVDLFGGSGSTLIAAQETNRIAYLMELDPHYIDVICARYQKHTGIEPVLEATGVPYNFSTE